MGSSLIIRADAHVRIGSGHVMRCIALGQAWKDAGGNVVFITYTDSEFIARRIVQEGFQLVSLSVPYPDSDDDSTVVLEMAERTGAKWVVADGYHFDLAYQRRIKNDAFKLLLIDDYNHLAKYEADILLNQNLDAETLHYQCNTQCRLFLGIRYILLRKEFRQSDSNGHIRNGSGYNLLITMGGSDPDNASLEVLHAVALLENHDEMNVKVLVGPSNLHIDSLRRALSKLKINGEALESVRDMPGLMQWTDFCITAAGGTCWELAVMNVPFITVTIAANQERIGQRLNEVAGVPAAGWVDQGFRHRCKDVLSAYMAGVSPHGPNRKLASLIDRFGVDRVLCKPATESGLDLMQRRLALRCVHERDAELLFEWANDPLTRKNSFNSSAIPFDDHLKWLGDRICNDRTMMFILELDAVPCGHIRYELDECGDAVLSFVVAPGFREMGLGKKLVALSLENVAQQWDGCRVKAFALSENRASSRIFEQLGFTQQEVGPTDGKQCNLYYWSKVNHDGSGYLHRC